MSLIPTGIVMNTVKGMDGTGVGMMITTMKTMDTVTIPESMAGDMRMAITNIVMKMININYKHSGHLRTEIARVLYKNSTFKILPTQIS